MKKSLMTLAVLGTLAGASHAQSSITIYGTIDGGVRYQTNVNAAGDSRLSMGLGSIGTYNTNRLGFKGVEDLGGGMNAHFVLESGFNAATGALDNANNLLFNRSAFVGVGGAWGSVDLGRQYSVSFKTIGGYDPFNYKYVTIIPLASAAAGNGAGNTSAAVAVNGISRGTLGGSRFNNDIQYTGAFGPVTVRAEYAPGEVAGSGADGAAQAIGATYASGPITVGAAYTQKSINTSVLAIGAAAAGAPNYRDNKQWTYGAAWKWESARIAGGVIDEKQDNPLAGAGETRQKNTWLGASYNVSPLVELSAAYYRTSIDTAVTAAGSSGRKNLVIVGATYALSKRTNFYAEVDNAKTSGILLTAKERQTAVSMGVNHLF